MKLKLVYISLICGMDSLSDMISLVLNTGITKISENYVSLLNFYNKVFIPYSGALYITYGNEIHT